MNYYFEIEGERVDIPEHFHRFSVMVGEFIRAFDDADADLSNKCIPLTEHKKVYLEKIIDFFHLLKNNPDDKIEPLVNVVKDLQQIVQQVSISEESDDDIHGAMLEEDAKPKMPSAKPNVEKRTNVEKEKDNFKHLDHDIKVVFLPYWAEDFFDGMDKETLFQTCIFANFLLAHPFVEHAAFYMANKIKSMKSIAEMREYLNTEADFADDEFDLLASDLEWQKRLKAEGLLKPKDDDQNNGK